MAHSLAAEWALGVGHTGGVDAVDDALEDRAYSGRFGRCRSAVKLTAAQPGGMAFPCTLAIKPMRCLLLLTRQGNSSLHSPCPPRSSSRMPAKHDTERKWMAALGAAAELGGNGRAARSAGPKRHAAAACGATTCKGCKRAPHLRRRLQVPCSIMYCKKEGSAEGTRVDQLHGSSSRAPAATNGAACPVLDCCATASVLSSGSPHVSSRAAASPSSPAWAAAAGAWIAAAHVPQLFRATPPPSWHTTTWSWEGASQAHTVETEHCAAGRPGMAPGAAAWTA